MTIPAESLLRPSALITGSTDGIGLTTAKNLARLGYHVILHGRDAARIERAASAVQSYCRAHPDAASCASRGPGDVYTLPPRDLSTVSGSRSLAKDVQQLCQTHGLHLSVLLNNAGVYSESLVRTEDSLELTFAVNVVAPFVVTSLLLSQLSSVPEPLDPRIVVASSISQCQRIGDWETVASYEQRRYSSHAAYSESKLLDAMLCIEMAERLAKARSRVTCNCLDPGTVNTKMLLAGWGPCGIPVEDALDETWLCSSGDVTGVSGKYFVNRHERSASLTAYDAAERTKLWSLLKRLAPDAAAVWEGL